MAKVENITKSRLPVFLQVSSTIIIVMGIVGFLFFTAASIYQFNHPNFLYSISNINNQYIHLNVYILIQSLLHIILIISGILIIKLKKFGFYLFFSVYLILLASEIFYENRLFLNYVIVGLILLFILVIYYRRFI